MSEERDALERAQARLKEFEAKPSMDESLEQLASSLENEADRYQQLLEKGERRTLARESTPPAARLMTFGFALGFVGPIVAMVGVSSSRFLHHQPELASVVLGAGVLLIIGTLVVRTQRAVAHLFSPEWRVVKRARRLSVHLRTLLS